VSDLRWAIVVCCGCGREYRCTPNTDYYHPRGTPQSERTATAGRCWDCHLEHEGVPPQPEPMMGDPMFVEPRIT